MTCGRGPDHHRVQVRISAEVEQSANGVEIFGIGGQRQWCESGFNDRIRRSTLVDEPDGGIEVPTSQRRSKLMGQLR